MLLVDLWYLKFYSEFAAYKLPPCHTMNHLLFNCLTRTKVSEPLFYMFVYLVNVGVEGRRAVLNVLNEILETKN